MDAPKKFSRIIDRKRYDVKTATLIADDVYCVERSGRNEFLYRTANGAYFTVNLTQWQGERDTLTPVTQAEAIELFEGSLTEHYVKYAEAFPGVEVKEA